MDDRFRRATDAADMVAFDVFDTLVVRPFMRPADLFGYLEDRYDSPGFAVARKAAEREVRESSRDGTRLDDIYALLPDFREMRDAEVEIEVRLCRPDLICRRIYEEVLSSGKRIAILSDMYLPTDVVASILESCGYQGYDILMVSGDLGVSKHDGSMYDLLLERIDTPPEDIVMIGDSRIPDMRMPGTRGIGAVGWKPLKDRYAGSHPREVRYARKGWAESMIAGIDALQWQVFGEEGYWREVSRRFGGPMSTGFVSFISENVPEGTDRLVFLSRDGYVPMMVYREVGGSLETTYMRSSRMVCKALSAGEDPDPDTLRSVYGVLAAAGCSLELGLPDEYDFGEMRKAYSENRDAISARLAEMREAVRSDVLSGLGGGNPVMVDSTTRGYTSQRFVGSLVGKDVHTMYYAVTADSDLGHSVYRDRTEEHLVSSLVNIAEYMFSSGEPPYCGIGADGEPLPSESPESESVRMAHAEDLLLGQLDYARFVTDLFGELPGLKGYAVDGWEEVLFSYEKKGDDPDRLSGARWAVDSAHSRSMHVIFRTGDLIRTLAGMAVTALRKMRFGPCCPDRASRDCPSRRSS